MIRTILSFGFAALVAVGAALWIAGLAIAFVATSIGSFLVWATSPGEGLWVSIVTAAVAAVAVGLTWSRRRTAGTDTP